MERLQVGRHDLRVQGVLGPALERRLLAVAVGVAALAAAVAATASVAGAAATAAATTPRFAPGALRKTDIFAKEWTSRGKCGQRTSGSTQNSATYGLLAKATS